MADSKKKVVTKTNRVAPKPVAAEEKVSMSRDELQALISSAISEGIKGGRNEETAKVPVQQLEVTLTQRINERMNEGQRFFRQLSNENGPREIIEIPKLYREFVGSAITSTINGSTVKVPVDGKRYYVHPAHYAAIREKLKYLDRIHDQNSRESDHFGDEGDYDRVRK